MQFEPYSAVSTNAKTERKKDKKIAPVDINNEPFIPI